MERVPLIARSDFPYDGKILHAGDHFEAVSKRDAETLKLLKRADDAPEPSWPRAKRQYRRKDLIPEQ